MRRIIWGCILFTVLLLITGCPGGGGHAPVIPPQTGTVEGFVYRSSQTQQLVLGRAMRDGDMPLAEATIIVRGLPSLFTTSDASGRFSLPNVPYGAQMLEVSCAGYTRQVFPVTVDAAVVQATAGNSSRPAPCKWTVLVYMCADNDMDAPALDDVLEMQQGALPASESAPPVKVFVQLDRPSNNNGVSGKWSDTRRFQIFRDEQATEITAPRVDDPPLGEVAMDDPASLQQFIAWGQEMAPAEHYLLILWDHGSGWDPSTDSYSRSICRDETSGINIALRDAELSQALTARDPIDVVMMDACLMSMLEVAYQIRDQADYLVASEDETPWEGYDYTASLALLMQTQGQITPAELARQWAITASESWHSYSRPISSAAIDLSKIGPVATSLDALSQRLIAIRDKYAIGLQNARKNTDTYEGYTIRDLWNYADALGINVPDKTMQSQVVTMKTRITDAVLVSLPGNNTARAHGLSIFLPPQEYFVRGNTRNSYGKLSFSEDTAWDEWLAVTP